jgi:ankyrin repeat protein
LVKCTKDSCTENEYLGDTPLAIAADKGHVDVVRVLLEGGANIERTNNLSRNALHRAAYYGHLNVCRLLLKKGAKVDPLDASKNTPLHEAAKGGYLPIVKLLVNKGANVSVRNIFGRNACDEARIWLKYEVADWLNSLSLG